MKIIALSFALISSAAFADRSPVFPQVYNYGFNIQVQVWNHTERHITCSGFVNMLTTQAQETRHFFESVPPRFTAFRSLYPRTNGQILNVYHSISCH